MMILLIDNYDSFTHNLARYLRRLQVDVQILRNDVSELDSVATRATAIVISPGPCGPLQAGQSVTTVQRWSGRIPILGICLGHQVICHAFGGNIVRASRPIHGQAFPIDIRSSDLFTGIPSGTCFARYHSLIAEESSLPKCLEVTATCQTPQRGVAGSSVVEVMAVQHRQHPTFGVQFHPESILSEAGYQLLANFLAKCGWQPPQTLPSLDLTDAKAAQWLHEHSVSTIAEHTAVLPQY
jgi:anthranilate synthase/aminodeoxychorismate synthase-like glutamine amidotransferase